jgi:hypothetical protein
MKKVITKKHAQKLIREGRAERVYRPREIRTANDRLQLLYASILVMHSDGTGEYKYFTA